MELRPWAVLLGLTLLPSLALAAGKCDRLVITGSPDAPPCSGVTRKTPRT